MPPKKVPSAYTALAQKFFGHVTAWVEQGSDPVIQKSTQSAGVCSVMVEEWIRSGVNDAEPAFRALLGSGEYAHFVKLQKQGDFVQRQVVRGDQFLVSDTVARGHMTLGDRQSLQTHQSTTYDRNKTVPGLTVVNLTDPPEALGTYLDFAFELSKAARRNLPPPAPASGAVAFYKLGLDDSEGGGGHAIGLKVEQPTGAKAHFSVLDPNTGEFTGLSETVFTKFWVSYMDQTYGKSYLGGTWSMLQVS